MVAGVGVGAVVLPEYWLTQLALTFVYVIATLGTDLSVGRAGVLSLCQASFVGLGAYVATVGATHGLFLAWQFVAAVVLCAVGGALLAIPTLRLSGMRLAIITLLFGTLFTWAIDVTIPITGGAEGMAVPLLSVGPVNSASAQSIYAFCGAFAIVFTLLVWQLSRGQWNRRLLAVRDSELAARSVGIQVVRTKVEVVILSAMLCGVAGVLYAYVEGFVSPSSFGTFPSAYLLVAVLLGGSGTLLGAWLGAGYITLVPDVFGLLGIPNLYALVGGLVLVAVTLLAPGGLVSVAKSTGKALGQMQRRYAAQRSDR